jgi:hypothetical protein
MDSNSVPRSRCISASAQRSPVVSTNLAAFASRLSPGFQIGEHRMMALVSVQHLRHREEPVVIFERMDRPSASQQLLKSLKLAARRSPCAHFDRVVVLDDLSSNRGQRCALASAPHHSSNG